jgi:hypothetical protein
MFRKKEAYLIKDYDQKSEVVIDIQDEAKQHSLIPDYDQQGDVLIDNQDEAKKHLKEPLIADYDQQGDVLIDNQDEAKKHLKEPLIADYDHQGDLVIDSQDEAKKNQPFLNIKEKINHVKQLEEELLYYTSSSNNDCESSLCCMYMSGTAFFIGILLLLEGNSFHDSDMVRAGGITLGAVCVPLCIISGCLSKIEEKSRMQTAKEQIDSNTENLVSVMRYEPTLMKFISSCHAIGIPIQKESLIRDIYHQLTDYHNDIARWKELNDALEPIVRVKDVRNIIFSYACNRFFPPISTPENQSKQPSRQEGLLPSNRLV